MWVQILLHRPREQTRVMLWGIFEWLTLLYIYGNLCSMLYGSVDGRAFGEKWIHVDGWLGHLDVHTETLHYVHL